MISNNRYVPRQHMRAVILTNYVAHLFQQQKNWGQRRSIGTTHVSLPLIHADLLKPSTTGAMDHSKWSRLEKFWI